MKRACIIGAGLGGLALAIRLQSAGTPTTLVEARDKPGGQAWYWEREGFTFDAGPGTLTDPEAFRELWQLSGRDLAGDVELMPVTPFCRFNWTDGAHFDTSADDGALRREIARIAPEDLGGYDEFVRYASRVQRETVARLGQSPFNDFTTLLKATPVLARHQGWRTFHAVVASFMKHEKLREAFTFHAIMYGGNPFSVPGMHALGHALEKDGGVWWPKGGMNRLVAAMVKHFERLGGTLRLHDPVLNIHTLGNRASEVECMSGWRERFDAVASNADLVHTYRDLLADSPRGPEMARKLAGKRYSSGMFVVHFGLEGSWPGIPHRMVLFGPRYKALLRDIFEHGVLPQDSIIALGHPSVTDPSVAPPGKSTFSAAIPVANMGKLPIDWEQTGPVIERRILDEIGRRLIPDIHDRIVTKFHYAPRDFALDLNAFRGSAFSLEPIMSQSGWLRAHNRDDKLKNVYLVGAGTHPGAGVPAVVASAKATAKLMLAELR